MVRGMLPVLYSAKKLNPQKLAQAKAALSQYPDNPPPRPRLGERRIWIAALLDEILSLRQKGYTFAQISNALLDKVELEIKPDTLRRYFSEELAKRQADGVATPKQPTPQGGRKRTTTSQKTGKKRAQSSQPAKPSPPHHQPAPLHNPEEANITATLDPQPTAEPKRWEPEPAPEANPETYSEASPKAGNPELNNPEHQPTNQAAEDWGDDDSQAGGLLDEPKFNRIRRN